MPFVSNVSDLIGVPFEYGGRGPNTYDCFGLLRELYRRSGVIIPDHASKDDMAWIEARIRENIDDWRPCEERLGAAISMRVKGYGAHVGYCLGGGKFVHTWEGTGGVTIERLSIWRGKILGIYEYVGNFADAH